MGSWRGGRSLLCDAWLGGVRELTVRIWRGYVHTLLNADEEVRRFLTRFRLGYLTFLTAADVQPVGSATNCALAIAKRDRKNASMRSDITF